MNKSIVTIIIFLTTFFYSEAQKILISPELDTRNDITFDLIGKINDKIIALRDKGNKKILNIYDDNLFRFSEKTISLEPKKTEVITTARSGNKFTVFYEINIKKKKFIKAKSFNKTGTLIDSINIKNHDTGLTKKYHHIISENNNLVLLYRVINNSTMDLTLIDLKKSKIIYDKVVNFKDVKLNSDYRQGEVSNKGEIYFVFEKKASIFNKSGHRFFIKAFYPKLKKKKQKRQTLKFNSTNLKIKYDNKNNILNIVGLITKLYEVKSIGYYVYQYSNQLKLINEYKNFFTNDLLKKYYKLENKKLQNHIKSIKLINIILRNDSGLILLMEKVEIIKRKSNTYYPRQQYLYNDTDYIYGNIVIVSIHETGKEYWSKIIPKNQLSSNDFGLYSSFFSFNTPSFLNIIFNDEIKNNNQIIMYTLNPIGQSQRKSIFSTDTYNINLAIKKAIQISGSQIIIPSFKKDKLKLVIIDF